MKKKYRLHEEQYISFTLRRFAVLGGWLYSASCPGSSSAGFALYFVPDPNVEIEE